MNSSVYHVSQEFFDRVRALFESTLRELHPRLESSVAKPLSDWQSSIRFREPIRDIALECQLRMGHPSTCDRACIGPHVDREVALYAGLFYMRDDDDDSEGGDLELYRFTRRDAERFDAGSRPRPRRTRHALQDDPLCQQHARVLSAFAAVRLHGVSPRSPTKFPRRHINLVGELATRVFDLSEHGLARHITLIPH